MQARKGLPSEDEEDEEGEDGVDGKAKEEKPQEVEVFLLCDHF